MDMFSKKTQQFVQKVRTKSTSNLAQLAAKHHGPNGDTASLLNTSHEELAVPLNQSIEYAEENVQSTSDFDSSSHSHANSTTTPTTVIENLKCTSPFQRNYQPRSPVINGRKAFINENRLTALSKELAASASALNEIGLGYRGDSPSHQQINSFFSCKRQSSSENLIEDSDSFSLHHVSTEIPIEFQNAAEKSKSESVVRNGEHQSLSSTPRKHQQQQQRVDPKLLKLSRSSASSSPTSVTSQLPSSPSPYSSMSRITSETYKQATQAYRCDTNLNSQLKMFGSSHSSSNTASISSTASSSSINNVNVCSNYRPSSVIIKRFNSPNSSEIEANELFNKFESELMTPTKTKTSKPGTPQSSSTIQTPAKTNEIWLEYGCI